MVKNTEWDSPSVGGELRKRERREARAASSPMASLHKRVTAHRGQCPPRPTGQTKQGEGPSRPKPFALPNPVPTPSSANVGMARATLFPLSVPGPQTHSTRVILFEPHSRVHLIDGKPEAAYGQMMGPGSGRTWLRRDHSPGLPGLLLLHKLRMSPEQSCVPGKRAWIS